ncbi:MFS transporter [Nonomuraea diastatica]|uniref:MFS transporter n=1 Tax=Nonomuraea diastatica TaxID=1848329 RepID=A0A4V6PCX6_9ACTN|nr:MFS transporter [Nonomuraea diastatica]TDD14606.1 MFS transporter [Nonomuraea diastatica]
MGKGFLPLWLSSTISNFGDGMRYVALPLLAYHISSEPVDISLVAILSSLPWILGGTFVGVLVDRVNRRIAVFVANIARVVPLTLLVIAVLTGQAQMWHVYVLAFTLPIFEAVVDTASVPLIQQAVPDKGLEKANARFYIGRILSQDVLGSPAAGFLFAFSAAAPFIIDGFTFVVAALLIFLVPPAPAPPRTGQRLLAAAKEGVRVTLSTPVLRQITLMAAVVNFMLMAGAAILVIYAKEDLRLTDPQFGMLFTVAAVGSVMGGVLAPKLVHRFGTPVVLVFSVALQGAARLLFGLADGLIAAYIAYFCAGVAAFVWHVAANAYRQRTTDNSTLGRVMATSFSLSHAAAALGAVAAGLTAELFGARPVMIGGGIGVLLCAAVSSAVLLRDKSGVAGEVTSKGAS